MAYTSVSRSDKNQYGLKSHVIPVIIAIAYMVDSIGAEMSMLRVFTLILAACYVVSTIAGAIQQAHARRKSRRSAEEQ